MQKRDKVIVLQSAFSLVELSIVLVILGLLVGGVLAGKSLIRASELRAIITERDKFTSAIYAFRDKYFQLPGDMNNAYQFWGATCGTNTTAVSTGCNGDGDGQIEEYAVAENVKAWEHMARAGLIEGNYDGTGGIAWPGVPASTCVWLDANNTPASKFPQLYWDVTNDWFTVAGNAGNLPPSGLGGILLRIGAINSGSPYIVMGSSSTFSRTDAWHLDTKTDDGQAKNGKVRGSSMGAMLPCTDSGTDYYSVLAGATITDCTLTFILKQ